MKKLLMFLFVFVLCMGQAIADPITTKRGLSGRGWVIETYDDDVDTSAELLTKLDTTYAQLAAEDTIEVLSASAGDITQTVTVTGVNNSGNLATEAIALNTSNGTTAVTSSTTFRYIDQIEVDAECAGIITVRRATGDTFINSIAVGELIGDVAQHLNGEKRSFVQKWSAVLHNTPTAGLGWINLELRWYPSDADTLDATDGFMVIDRLYASTPDVMGNDLSYDSEGGVELPAGGWLAVYGTGSVNNEVVSAQVIGFDKR